MLLDLALGPSLRTKMIPLNKDDARQLYDSPTGALSSFSNKIKMAYALGVISQETRKSCDLLREIRNAFAHSILDLDCDSPDIKAVIDRLPNPRSSGAEEWDGIVPGGKPKPLAATDMTINGQTIDLEDMLVVTDQVGQVGVFYPDVADRLAFGSPREAALFTMAEHL